ncbi:hypothetical protein [Pseudomonas sp. NMS19W]|uniref:hypothetical protein n=1 Tax=Pseudomonas sp. NMS19W TaxID=3079768 RepID=UPI003F6558BF
MRQSSQKLSDFLRRYSSAKENVRRHVSQQESDVRVGSQFGVVEDVLVLVYEEDGSLAHEILIDERVLVERLGTADITVAKALEVGREEARRLAGDFD